MRLTKKEKKRKKKTKLWGDRQTNILIRKGKPGSKLGVFRQVEAAETNEYGKQVCMVTRLAGLRDKAD